MLGFVCRKAAVPELRAAIANNEDELEVMVMCKKKKVSRWKILTTEKVQAIYRQQERCRAKSRAVWEQIIG